VIRYAPRSEAAAIEYGVARYGMEVQRMFDVLDQHLADKAFVAGDEYTIADMAIYPWLSCVQNEKAYNAGKFLDTKQYKNVQRYCEVIAARPAVQKGMKVCGWD
jgi:GST-like protein